MAIFKTITIEYGFTFDLGNYNSVRSAAAFTVELDEGELVIDVVAALQEKARREVHTEIDRTLEQTGHVPYFQEIPS